jgi:hypothetical protein
MKRPIPIRAAALLLGALAVCDAPVRADEKKAEASASAPKPGDTLLFLNRDALHGKLVSIDPARGVAWQSPASPRPLEFKIANIAEIRLDDRKPQSQQAANPVSVELANTDELHGNLVSLDSEKLELDTWYAGRLSVPRSAVSEIATLTASTSVIYQGPDGIAGWKTGDAGNGAWQYRDGAFIATQPAAISRDFKLPDMANIEFDALWRPNLRLVVNLFTDSAEARSGNCYMLQFTNGYAMLQRLTRNAGSNVVGQARVPNFSKKTKAHIGIRANREAKTIALFIDGQRVQEWKDHAGFAGKGTGLQFYYQSSGFMKISGIKISAWDGKYDEVAAGPAKQSEDSIRLVNGDVVSGKLEAIRDGSAAFASAYAKLDIPLKRIAQIHLAGDAPREKHGPDDVRAFFADRGSVTFAVEKWDDKNVVAHGAGFGSATFSPEAFARIQFNLDQKPPKDDDSDGGTDAAIGAAGLLDEFNIFPGGGRGRVIINGGAVFDAR